MARVCEACNIGIPCIIHDYPAVTGITLSVELITRIFQACDFVSYIKLEDPPTGAKMQALAASAGTDLNVFGALGGMYAFEELELGAVGIMTGFVYAELLVQLFDLAGQQDWKAAADLFFDFLPLNRWEFQPGIGVSLRKQVLFCKDLGVLPGSTWRTTRGSQTGCVTAGGHPGCPSDNTYRKGGDPCTLRRI